MYYYWIVSTRTLHINADTNQPNSVLVGFVDTANHHHEKSNSKWYGELVVDKAKRTGTREDEVMRAKGRIMKDEEIIIDYWSGSGHRQSRNKALGASGGNLRWHYLCWLGG